MGAKKLWNDMEEGKLRTRRKIFPRVTFPQQIIDGLTWDGIPIFAVRVRRPIAWVTAGCWRLC